jgi:hypothetical protein
MKVFSIIFKAVLVVIALLPIGLWLGAILS